MTRFSHKHSRGVAYCFCRLVLLQETICSKGLWRALRGVGSVPPPGDVASEQGPRCTCRRKPVSRHPFAKLLASLRPRFFCKYILVISERLVYHDRSCKRVSFWQYLRHLWMRIIYGSVVSPQDAAICQSLPPRRDGRTALTVVLKLAPVVFARVFGFGALWPEGIEQRRKNSSRTRPPVFVRLPR